MSSLVRRDTVIPVPLKTSKNKERRRDDVREFLAFGLAGERFALPLASVREILKLAQITEVPRGRHYVLGILSVRGRITTVIDLRRRLKLPGAEPTKMNRILLVQGAQEVIGLLVDEVYQVYRLGDDDIEMSAVVAGDLSDYVMGIGRPASGEDADEGPDDILILLDPEPLLRR